MILKQEKITKKIGEETMVKMENGENNGENEKWKKSWRMRENCGDFF